MGVQRFCQPIISRYCVRTINQTNELFFEYLNRASKILLSYLNTAVWLKNCQIVFFLRMFRTFAPDNHKSLINLQFCLNILGCK